MKKVFNFLVIFLWCLGFCASFVFADPPNKGKWTSDEDDRLRAGVSRLGENRWPEVSEQYVRTRSSKQCRERWKHYLSTNKDTPWNFMSDSLLLELYNKRGPNWRAISRFIPGKSETNVKSRFNYLMSNDGVYAKAQALRFSSSPGLISGRAKSADNYLLMREQFRSPRKIIRFEQRQLSSLEKCYDRNTSENKFPTIIPPIPDSISEDPLPVWW